MSKSRINIGVIGCGVISDIYLENSKLFDVLQITACADLDQERAEAKAAKYGIQAYTVEALLAQPDIDIILNLTVPQAHAQVGLAAITFGKSVYNEKPLAVSREDGRQLLDTARSKGLLVGCAPDTFLGGGLQTCRKLIDDGAIGRPVAATAFMLGHGPEGWHPDPVFFYQPGAGPMFDMGPYYLTALVALMGPAKRVTGLTSISFPERTITSKPKYSQKITVNTPTHIAGLLEFANGAIGTIITSFDVWGSNLPFMEIYGTEGTLNLPDPNTFGGPVRLRRAGEKEWTEMPLTHGYMKNCRGVGLADMAYALRSGRAHRANGEMAYHVLDLMHAFHDSSNQGQHIELSSTCSQPAALPIGLAEYTLDE